MKKYALIGKDVDNSLSPKIHRLISDFHNVPYEYHVINVRDEEEFLSVINDGSYSGFNITAPYKLTATRCADTLCKRVKVCKSTNTIKREENKLYAYTTDGVGFLKSLEFGDLDIRNKKVLVYGSGGAARSIILSLLEAGASSVMIAARNVSERITVYDLFKGIFSSKLFIVENCFGVVCDMVINTTPVGSYSCEGLSLNPKNMTIKTVYDIVTTPSETELVSMARNLGLKVFTGIDMLILQAYYSFAIWHEVSLNDETAYEIFSLVKANL